MKLKIRKLEKGPMVLTGSKVLELIQDNYTPHIDLLVRESIQNSADAILNEKDYGKIVFKVGEFNKESFSNKIDAIGENIVNAIKSDSCDFLAISDYNTCGLLGEPYESDNGNPNNLYSLVYDIMNRKSGMVSGGSHGIGKSVYYRYGLGICLFYSRTYEDGVYVSKLAGALIQDETKETCLLGKHTSGIAYFGDISKDNKPIPIYDESEISEFLSIFDIKLYNGNETGTTVIIPFINKNMMLSNTINEDNGSCYWLNDFEESLRISIQRWYFARLNNELYNGKYIKCAVNNKKVELNEFFVKLQDLYNGTLNGVRTLNVLGNKLGGASLGRFNYKVFSKEELGMLPPINLPSPKYLVDSSYDVDEQGMLFYLRKPGMVINYENSKFGTYFLDDDKYLIGAFVLNDDASFEGENLGAYLRKSEEANHKEWNDINSDSFSYLKSKKPFKQICSFITKKLTEEFKQNKAITLDGGNTILQKKLGEKLMPPSGFGKGAEPGESSGGGGSATKKEKKSKISFAGMDVNGLLVYELEVSLNNEETTVIDLNVKAGGKSYSFNQWEKLNFTFPCEIARIDILELNIDKKKNLDPQNISLDDNFIKRRKKTIDSKDIYKVKGTATAAGVPYGIKLYNCCGKKMSTKIKICILPVDNKYQITFHIDFSEVKL